LPTNFSQRKLRRIPRAPIAPNKLDVKYSRIAHGLAFSIVNRLRRIVPIQKLVGMLRTTQCLLENIAIQYTMHLHNYTTGTSSNNTLIVDHIVFQPEVERSSGQF
jgi:hypothetical protein